MPTRNAVRLLIADDDPNALTAYVLFFDAHGYETRTTGDGAVALAEYDAWRPDAVVHPVPRSRRRCSMCHLRSRPRRRRERRSRRACRHSAGNFCCHRSYRNGSNSTDSPGLVVPAARLRKSRRNSPGTCARMGWLPCRTAPADRAASAPNCMPTGRRQSRTRRTTGGIGGAWRRSKKGSAV